MEEKSFSELASLCSQPCSFSEDRTKAREAASELSALIISGNHELSDLIEAFNSLLSSSDERQRQLGTRALADVIQCLCDDPDFLTLKQRTVFASFFFERIEDRFSLSDTLRGCAILINTAPETVSGRSLLPENANTQSITLIAHAATAGLSCEAKIDALAVLEATLEDTYGSDALSAASALRGLYVGERDTMLLMGAFKLTAMLLRRVDPSDLGESAQPLFDAFSAYFPILFVPRDSKVSKQDVVASLRECFASNPAFCTLAFPFLADKTASSIASARADAFATLACCVRSYGPKVKDPDGILSCVFTSLRANAFGSELEAAADSVVLLVSACVDVFAAHSKSFVDAFYNDAIDMLLPPSSSSQPSTDKKDVEVQYDFDPETAAASRLVVGKLFRLPCFFNDAKSRVTMITDRFMNSKDKASRMITVAALSDIASTLSDTVTSPSDDIVSAFNAMKKVFSVTVTEVKEPILSQMFADACTGFACLSRAKPSILSDDFVSECVSCLVSAASDTTHPSTLRRSIFTFGLKGICETRSAIVSSKLDDIFSILNDDVVSSGIVSLAKSSSEIFTSACERLSHLFLSCSGPDDINPLVLQTWVDVLRCGRTLESDKSISIITRLFNSAKTTPEKFSKTVLPKVKEVVAVLTEGTQGTEAQNAILEATNEPGEVLPCISLRCSVLSSLDESHSTKLVEDGVLVSFLLSRASKIFEITDPLLSSVCVSIAALTNKSSSSAETAINEAVTRAVSRSESLALAWFARALLHKKCIPLATTALSSLCSIATRSTETSSAFAVLSSPECPLPEGLTESSHANLLPKETYGKLLFDSIAQKLLDLRNDFPASPSILSALAHVLSIAPSESVAPCAEKCSPAAAAAVLSAPPPGTETDIISAAAVRAGIAMVRALAAASPSVLVCDIRDFRAVVGRMCEVATKHRDTHTRVDALELLLEIQSKVAQCHTLPLQKVVTRALKPCLDDDKRPVRSAAVKCINAWICFKQEEDMMDEFDYC